MSRGAVLVRRVDHALLPPMLPERLAIVRILAGGFALIDGLRRARVWAGLGDLDAKTFAPVGVVGLLDAPLPAAVWKALLLATALGLLAFIAGFRHRVLAPVCALLFLFVTSYRSSFSMVFHSDNLIALHLGVLALAPAADALSLDALRKPGPPEPRPQYGWPLRTLALLTAAAYLMAGIAKLRGSGLVWAEGQLLAHHVAFNAVRKAELGGSVPKLVALALEHRWIFRPLAAGSLLLELAAPLALLHARIARPWAIGVVAFHWGVHIVMGITFAYPMTGIPFAMYFPLERALPRRAVPQRARASTRL